MSKDPTGRQSTAGTIDFSQKKTWPLPEMSWLFHVEWSGLKPYTQRTKTGTASCKKKIVHNIYEYVTNIIKEAIKLRSSVCRRSLKKGSLPTNLKIGGA